MELLDFARDYLTDKDEAIKTCHILLESGHGV